MFHRLKGPGTETQRQTRKITVPTAKAQSISNVRKRDGKSNGGVVAQDTDGRGAAHSNSEDSIGTGNHARREKQNPKPDLAAEAGTGACEMSSTLNALKETQNT